MAVRGPVKATPWLPLLPSRLRRTFDGPRSANLEPNMVKYAAFLRGINVGGHNAVPMGALAAAFTAAGSSDVRTYIQSGNVAFAHGLPDQAELVMRLQAQLLREFGFAIPVVLRSGAELQQLLAANPLRADDSDPTKLAVNFLSAVPPAERIAALDPQRSAPDRFAVVGREVFLHCPQGFGRTKLTIDYFEKHLGVTATSRNWRTVTTMAEWTR